MEEILESAGEIGLFQKLMIGFIGLASSSLGAMCIYATVFATAVPKLICNLKNSTINANYTVEETCNIWYNVTRIHNTEYECTFDKTYYGETMSSEWKLVCNEQFLISISQTSQICGALCSMFSGYFGDRYGRRRSSLVFTFLLSLVLTFTQILQIHSLFNFKIYTRFIIYTIAQFFIGMLVNCSYCTTYVLLLELTTEKYHTIASNINSYIYVLGELIVLGGYYFTRNWQALNWITTVYSIFSFVLMYFFLPESPEWLISVKRHKEAYKILCKIARINSRKKNFINDYSDPEYLIKFDAIGFNDKNNVAKDIIDKTLNEQEAMLKKDTINESKTSYNDQLMDLLWPKKSLIKLILLVYVWNSLMLLYYGISLGITSINLIDPYLMFLLSSIFEILGCIISYINDYIGRKKTFSLFLIISSIMSLLVVVIPTDQSDSGITNKSVTYKEILVVIFALISKSLISGAYAIIYIYTSELYSTYVRSTALLFLMCVGGVGSFIAPQINLLRTLVWTQFPYVVFCASALVGVFCLRFLPETKGKRVHLNEM